MKNSNLLAILFICLFLIQGCVSTSTLTVERIRQDIPIDSAAPAAYDTFWDAMQNLDFSYLQAYPVLAGQQSFADGLRMTVDGKIPEAENEFRKLLGSETDPVILEYAQSMLERLLFFQGDWQALLEISGHDEDTDGTGSLITAYNSLPPVNYLFPDQPVEIPMKLSLSGCPMIEVTVNGHQKTFWIDTGAGLSVVASDIASECGITPIGEESIAAGTATSKTIPARPAVIDDLAVGDFQISNLPVMILDKKDLEFKVLGVIKILKIDGIIGWNAIQKMDIEIDYRNGATTIRKPVDSDSSNRNFFWIDYPIVSLWDRQGQRLHFGLDTGARKSSLTENILKKITFDDVHTKSVHVGSAGGFEKTESKIIPDISLILNDYSLNFHNIETHSQMKKMSSFVQLDGILGSDVFHNGTVRMNCIAGTLDVSFPQDVTD